jgi:hypothetical protein
MPHAQGEAAVRIADALRRIVQSVDPCGESAEVTAVLDRLETCARASYEIRTSATADRNLFERSTITWNPDLRSELEPAADGRSVMRDPIASLLHELVHAAHECAGLNPGEHELEAVRIENIYRRAVGLAQRTRYGDDPLPSAMVRVCGRESCPCSIPRSAGERTPAAPASPAGQQAADSASTLAESAR